jgi:hypothetical protein
VSVVFQLTVAADDAAGSDSEAAADARRARARREDMAVGVGKNYFRIGGRQRKVFINPALANSLLSKNCLSKFMALIDSPQNREKWH